MTSRFLWNPHPTGHPQQLPVRRPQPCVRNQCTGCRAIGRFLQPGMLGRPAYLSLRIGNQGTAPLRHTSKSPCIRSQPPNGCPEIIEVSPPIYPGEVSDTFDFTFDAAEVGSDHLAIVVDDADGLETIRECNENNTLMLLDATCG